MSDEQAFQGKFFCTNKFNSSWIRHVLSVFKIKQEQRRQAISFLPQFLPIGHLKYVYFVKKSLAPSEVAVLASSFCASVSIKRIVGRSAIPRILDIYVISIFVFNMCNMCSVCYWIYFLQNMEAYSNDMIASWDHLLYAKLSGDVKALNYGCPG